MQIITLYCLYIHYEILTAATVALNWNWVMAWHTCSCWRWWWWGVFPTVMGIASIAAALFDKESWNGHTNIWHWLKLRIECIQECMLQNNDNNNPSQHQSVFALCVESNKLNMWEEKKRPHSYVHAYSIKTKRRSTDLRDRGWIVLSITRLFKFKLKFRLCVWCSTGHFVQSKKSWKTSDAHSEAQYIFAVSFCENRLSSFYRLVGRPGKYIYVVGSYRMEEVTILFFF